MDPTAELADDNEEAKEEEGNNAEVVSAQEEPTLPTKLPQSEDPEGCNAKFMTAHVIDTIRRDHFRKRKKLCVKQMASLGATVMKMDANRKTAKRIKVTIDGKSFKPWECILVIKNECNKVMWWAMLPHQENCTKLKPHLQKLK